jgi:hypothetical protein
MRWGWVAKLALVVLGLFVLLLFLGLVNLVLGSSTPLVLILTVVAVILAAVLLVALMLWSRDEKISAR